MEKLILKCGLSPGDLVMLTAAVRDLHLTYPGRFLTDVRTPCPDLWLNNPHLTPLDDNDPDVRTMDCHYPLINRCNELPRHCLEGFIDFLNAQLGLRILLTQHKGDIHLSVQEKAWFSQVHELTGGDTPFWIVDAGGKHDVTIKWWAVERYQEVVDHFRGKILFVQVGQQGHHHPRLKGVVDLRGCTSLRMLVRLVYHAQGVVCPVTCLMHLAAAVECKPGPSSLRPCVVVAGGREPAHWEQYPGHQFLHTIGALRCCARGGCWKDRTEPLGDGDERDKPHRVCDDVVGHLPRCMNLITSRDVTLNITRYFEGGAISYLSGSEWQLARRGIKTTANNPFERLSLTSANVRLECERFIRRIPQYPDSFRGRGIVIGAGGCRYFVGAWVTINLLRQLGCQLPIQVWHLGPSELDSKMAELLKPLNVECVDAFEVRKRVPCRVLNGWELKCYAMVHSPFEEVLYLDADNVPVVNPEYLFDTPAYREKGAAFWPDLGSFEKTHIAWELLGVECPPPPEFESGQMLVNKKDAWRGLSLAMWLNENSDFFYRYLHGDKETFHLAFVKIGQPFAFAETPVHPLPGTMCQHDFAGRRVFQHRNTDKWNLFANNPPAADFWWETDCRNYIRQLQQRWSGNMEHGRRFLPTLRPKTKNTPPTLSWGMISCRARDEVRAQTLQRLDKTDLDLASLMIEMDPGAGTDPKERQTQTAFNLLQRFLAERRDDYLLFLEDDLDFNQHLHFNLTAWPPLLSRKLMLGSLFNPGLIEDACDLRSRSYLVRCNRMFGSQALLISRKAALFFVEHWNEVKGMQDIKMSRLVGRLKQPVWYHSPSLVQHLGGRSTWGGAYFVASDFDPAWKAE